MTTNTTDALREKELHPVAHIELGDDSHDVVTLEAAKAYGEQCWKAGYKHGAWADKPEPTSKQSLQVEPVVNQQLTTEPVDEREAFEKVFPTPSHCQRCGDGYAATSYNAWEAHNHIERWKGWQARAAMAQVGDINVVESFTNDTKDAERYRWIADSNNYYEAINLISDGALTKDALVKVIDAARAKGVKW